MRYVILSYELLPSSFHPRHTNAHARTEAITCPPVFDRKRDEGRVQLCSTKKHPTVPHAALHLTAIDERLTWSGSQWQAHQTKKLEQRWRTTRQALWVGIKFHVNHSSWGLGIDAKLIERHFWRKKTDSISQGRRRQTDQAGRDGGAWDGLPL